MSESKINSVLIVDDENSNIMMITKILNPYYTVYAAKNGEAAIKAADKYIPDVILLDILMPDMDGYTVLAALKKSENTRNIPVIFITGLSNAADEEKGLTLGAVDYITKPFSSVIVKLRVHNQIKMLDQLRLIERLSKLDQLTELPNRRSFDEQLHSEWRRAVREQKLISILMIDVDKFKNYNDTYGHQQGDVALRAIAKTINSALKRSNDFAARWGGEEFSVLLPSTDSSGAFEIAEQIRRQIEDMNILSSDGSVSKVTVSIGINAIAPADGGTINELISGADEMLYKAKKNGRNIICNFTDRHGTPVI